MEEAQRRKKSIAGGIGWGGRGLRVPFWMIGVAFFLIEVFAFVFLTASGGAQINLWPLAFGLLWAGLLAAITILLPPAGGRVFFCIAYFVALLYAAVQTGYYYLFREMLWLSEFLYASEGVHFLSVLLQYPLRWWVLLGGCLAFGVLVVWRFPVLQVGKSGKMLCAGVVAACLLGAVFLPRAIFLYDRQTQYAQTDYGRARSAEAVYKNMFNAHGLYQVCGVYQTGIKDAYREWVYPLTPAYARIRSLAGTELNAYFSSRKPSADNSMTGVFAGKNLVFVLMESMDDWVLGEHTPTICRLMEEGIEFTDFYTPPYGGVRTFNTEFCVNTGSYLSSGGGYAFEYATNGYSHALANRLARHGYSSKVYHYNAPSFYSRGVFSKALGYEEYVSYEHYVDQENRKQLFNDQFLFDNQEVANDFFRTGRKLNFIITRSAHMSYRYNDLLSHWGLEKYPQYRGLTGHEELDCLYLKARLVDDLFARLLQELERSGELENTVIVAVTDHYTYGFQDTDLMMERSGVSNGLLLEKTPCFIWSKNCVPMKVDKTLNTADLLPTVLNMMGVKGDTGYLGRDAFDPDYPGYAIFSNGSWISRGIAYIATDDSVLVLQEGKTADNSLLAEMAQKVHEFVYINNLILETDYYAQ